MYKRDYTLPKGFEKLVKEFLRYLIYAKTLFLFGNVFAISSYISLEYSFGNYYGDSFRNFFTNFFQCL